MIGAVIQARMGSTRFPGKVLMPFAGRPLLSWLVERLRRANDLDAIIVATSGEAKDDALAKFCDGEEIECFRGPEDDVLGRYLQTAKAYDLDVIVRVCGDAPLTDPNGIFALVSKFKEGNARFVHNRHIAGWPIGTAADLMTVEALTDAAAAAERPDQREHVVPYLLENPVQFETRLVYGPKAWLTPPYHLAVDYPNDMHWLNALFKDRNGANPAEMDIPELLKRITGLEKKPELFIWADQ